MSVALLSSLTPEELNALSGVPALTPPPGVESNFVNPQNQSLSFLLVTSFLFGVMAVFFVNRIYTKALIVRKYSWDDLTIVIAFISAIAYYVASIWGVQEGKVGVHQWDINIPDILSLNLLIPEYLASVLTEVALLFTKATFFFMYLSIFGPMQWMRIASWLGLLANTGFYLAVLIANMIFSTPRPGQSWQQAAFNEQGTLGLSIPQAVGGLIIDLYILALPIIAVSKLQLPTRRKVGVILIFMSGALAVAASILKIYYSYVLINTTDLTWASLPINIVTFTEISVGISCACMPSAAHTCRHHASSFGYVRKAFSKNLKSLSLKSSLRSSSPTSPSSDQNGLLEKNLNVNNDPYSRLDSQSVQSEGWVHNKQSETRGIHSQRPLPKFVPIVISGENQDILEQSRNQSSYARVGSELRSPPRGLRPPRPARTLINGADNFERIHEPHSELDSRGLYSESIDYEIAPPVPPKEYRHAPHLSSPRGLRPPRAANTVERRGNQSEHERNDPQAAAEEIYRRYKMRTDFTSGGRL
ncbi:hypothetical protein MMC11_004671 [Xylographa trunciseda]|nr:hypothetical protein [Xylographa trunciseda]